MLSGSTRSVVFLIKILVWETVHHNVFVSKIGSESRSRGSSGREHRPVARLEWLRRNLKFRGGTFRYRGETGVRTLVFLKIGPENDHWQLARMYSVSRVNRPKSTKNRRMSEQHVVSKFDRHASCKISRFYENGHSLSSDANAHAGVLFPSVSGSRTQ
jgi:hypothetical protein